SFAAGTSRTRANISGIGGNNSGQQRVIKCFNCQGEGHMARQCPKPKRKSDATWFRDKVLMVKAQRSGKALNEEELEFLADPKVAEGPVTQTVITHNATYQADDLDAYNSDCDDFFTAKVVLMANLYSYGSDVLSENEITSNSNIIPYSQYLLETQNTAVQDINSSAQQDAMILFVFEQLSNQVKLLEERQHVDLSTREKLIMDDIIWEKNAQFADFKKEINHLKQALSKQSKENELLTTTFNVFKNESKEKEAKNIDIEIALEKKFKELDNIKAQHIRPMLYNGSVIAKETNVISIADSEETLMLEEENQSATSPIKIEAPQDLRKASLLNTNLKKFKYHLGQFNNVVKKQITPDALTKREWGFEHAKAIFLKEIIPFVKTLKGIFNVFDKYLLNENDTSVNQTEPSFDQLFEFNNLKAELQAKVITIKKLKANIKRLNKASTTNNVKKDIDEIETINIELEHREKVLVITTLKNDLRKFNGKDIVDNAAQVSKYTTIAPRIASYSTCKYVKLIQELLGYVRDTCPDIPKPSGKLVTVTPINKKKRVSRSTKSSRLKSTDNTKNGSNSKPKVPKTNGSNSKPKIEKSVISNKTELNTSRGSSTSVAPCSSSSVDLMLSKLFCGDDLLSGSQETNIYTFSMEDMMASSPIYLLSKASKDKILVMASTIVTFELCKKQSHKPKSEDTNQEKLNLLHMDLCGPMRVASINGKKYILVIVDDYSQFTWVKFLASKDEAPDFIIKLQMMIQV
ncbi:retrovirus-related pol polyprotein from transposon TNT 1-94, partial [Tanacetum coccineum]